MQFFLPSFKKHLLLWPTSPTDCWIGIHFHSILPVGNPLVTKFLSGDLDDRSIVALDQPSGPGTSELQCPAKESRLRRVIDPVFPTTLQESGIFSISQQHVYRNTALTWKFLAFSMINNLAGLRFTHDLPKVLKHLPNMQILQLLDHFRLRDSPFAIALAETIFDNAIAADDYELVAYVLTSRYAGVNTYCKPDIISRCRSTPIECAAKMGHSATVKVLLSHGANPNKTCDCLHHEFGIAGSGGALARATGRWKYTSFPKDELVPMLLSHGARLHSTTLEQVICDGDGILATTLVERCLQYEYRSWDIPKLLFRSVVNLDEQSALEIVKLLLPTAKSLNVRWRGEDRLYPLASNDIRFVQKVRGRDLSLIDVVVSKGHEELARLLLRSGAQLTKTTLYNAIESSSESLVYHLLEAGAEADVVVRVKSTKKRTPLSAAIKCRNNRIKQTLLEKGAWDKIEEPSRLQAALLAASKVGDREMLDKLLPKLRVWLNAKDMQCASKLEGCRLSYDLRKILTKSISLGYDDISKDPINELTSLDLPEDNFTESLLYEALRRQNVELATKVLNAGFALSIRDLPLALNCGLRSLVEDYIHLGEGLSAKDGGDRLFRTAIKNNDIALVDLLVSAGADPNAPISIDQDTYLADAVVYGNELMVRRLLDLGVDPNDPAALRIATSRRQHLLQHLLDAFFIRYPLGSRRFGIPALGEAIRAGDTERMQSILRTGTLITCSFDYAGPVRSSPLYVAIEKRASETLQEVKILLDSDPGANLNAVIAGGFRSKKTPLLLAISKGNTELVKLLIQYGADVNLPAKLSLNRTPLQQAAERGDIDIVRLLLSYKAEINAPAATNSGGTALQLAAIGGYLAVVLLLLEKGADVNAARSRFSGRTALEGAAEHGRLDTVQCLLNAGADVKGSGHQGYERALRFARTNGHQGVVKLLESHQMQTSKLDTPVNQFEQCNFTGTVATRPHSIDEAEQTLNTSWLSNDSVAEPRGKEFAEIYSELTRERARQDHFDNNVRLQWPGYQSFDRGGSAIPQASAQHHTNTSNMELDCSLSDLGQSMDFPYSQNDIVGNAGDQQVSTTWGMDQRAMENDDSQIHLNQSCPDPQNTQVSLKDFDFSDFID